jgi:hypothetical protein
MLPLPGVYGTYTHAAAAASLQPDTPAIPLFLQVVNRCVQMSAVLGVSLALVLTISRGSIPGMFSTDAAVLQLVAALLPAVIISQPINALAFVWDGVLFGAGGFRCVEVWVWGGGLLL